jgi:hypothetical protein
MFLTEDILSRMNVSDFTTLQNEITNSGASAWENLSTTDLDPSTMQLLAGLKL